MKKIITKESRMNAVREWIEKNSRGLSRRQKLKTYPTWIKIMEDKGETEMANMLYQEIEFLKKQKSKLEKLFFRIKNFFKRIIKKGS